jgi:hypothetical protein
MSTTQTDTNLSNLPKPKVKLTGSDGNAFMVIGATSKALRKAGWTSDQVDAFRKEAMSGDYNNVLCTCMKYADVR